MAIKRYNTYSYTTFFRDYLVAENLSKATIHNYSSDFDHFVGWLSLNSPIKVAEKGIDVCDLGQTFIPLLSGYKQYLLDKGVIDSTFTRKMYCLRKFGQACLDLGLITKEQSNQIVQITKHTVEKNYSWDQVLSEYSKTLPTRARQDQKKLLHDLKQGYF